MFQTDLQKSGILLESFPEACKQNGCESVFFSSQIFLSEDEREPFSAKLGFYNPQRPTSKLSLFNKSSHPGGRPRPPCSPPQAAHPERGRRRGAHPAGAHSPVGGQPPTVPARRTGLAGSGLCRECPPAPAGSRPASEPDRKRGEDNTGAAWKSPPGFVPEGDSAGLAGELPSHPSARTGGERGRLQETGHPPFCRD